MPGNPFMNFVMRFVLKNAISMKKSTRCFSILGKWSKSSFSRTPELRYDGLDWRKINVIEFCGWQSELSHRFFDAFSCHFPAFFDCFNQITDTLGKFAWFYRQLFALCPVDVLGLGYGLVLFQQKTPNIIPSCPFWSTYRGGTIDTEAGSCVGRSIPSCLFYSDISAPW